METDIEKGQKPAVVEVGYMSYLHFNVKDLDIDWTQVESIYCKYCRLTIYMKNGDEHTIDNYRDIETNYKWPKKMVVFDGDWAIIDEE
tara:strand:+ start:4 stop:267 length:264 start_codon:yes stop_codon:yes gene_type:complete